MQRKFAIGDYVKFNHAHGSVGKVIAFPDNGPWKDIEAYHVEYVYGRDMLGDVMSEFGRYLCPSALVAITEAEYLAVRDRKGFGS